MVCDTPSHGSDHLCLIWKESIHNCRWYRADTACGTDGRTDGRTDGVKPVYPPQQLRCAGGIIIYMVKLTMVLHNSHISTTITIRTTPTQTSPTQTIPTKDITDPFHITSSTLTHWGRDKMDAISQATHSKAFLWMKMLEFYWNVTEVCS